MPHERLQNVSSGEQKINKKSQKKRDSDCVSFFILARNQFLFHQLRFFFSSSCPLSLSLRESVFTFTFPSSQNLSKSKNTFLIIFAAEHVFNVCVCVCDNISHIRYACVYVHLFMCERLFCLIASLREVFSHKQTLITSSNTEANEMNESCVSVCFSLSLSLCVCVCVCVCVGVGDVVSLSHWGWF